VVEAHAPGEERAELVEDVVALHEPHAHAAQALGPGELDHRLGARARVHASRVRHDHDAALHDLAERRAQRLEEVPRVARAGLAQLLHAQDRHGDLGQVVEHHRVHRAAAHLVEQRVVAVAPEARGAGDAVDRHAAHSSVGGDP
jgi:hypothetical protein